MGDDKELVRHMAKCESRFDVLEKNMAIYSQGMIDYKDDHTEIKETLKILTDNTNKTNLELASFKGKIMGASSIIAIVISSLFSLIGIKI